MPSTEQMAPWDHDASLPSSPSFIILGNLQLCVNKCDILAKHERHGRCCRWRVRLYETSATCFKRSSPSQINPIFLNDFINFLWEPPPALAADVICFGTPKEWCRYECMCAWIIDICVAGWTSKAVKQCACRQTSSLMRGIANTCPSNKEYVKKWTWFGRVLSWITNQHILSFKPYFKNSHNTL